MVIAKLLCYSYNSCAGYRYYIVVHTFDVFCKIIILACGYAVITAFRRSRASLIVALGHATLIRSKPSPT